MVPHLAFNGSYVQDAKIGTLSRRVIWIGIEVNAKFFIAVHWLQIQTGELLFWGEELNAYAQLSLFRRGAFR